MSVPCEKDYLLSLLEAHGHSFLNGTGVDSAKKQDPAFCEALSEDEEEWHGISTSSQYSEETANNFECSDDDDDDDDEFVADSNNANVVVFSEGTPRKFSTQEAFSKSQMSAFMSSKVTKLRNLTDCPQPRKGMSDRVEDRTNAQNDALLHKLIHTKLLSGSLNQDLEVSPAQKRKSLEGRILELTGDAKLGKGKRGIQDAERNRAAKRVREGIAQKQKKRQRQELEEAKNLGNYHPSLKRIFEASSTSNNRKRQKGLGMGVGRFSNGSLHLSKGDINRVIEDGSRRVRKRI